MKEITLRFAAVTAALWLFAVVCAMPSEVASQPQKVAAFHCEKRTRVSEPPRALLPERRALGGDAQKLAPARKLDPVCPAGEVAVGNAHSTGYFHKGNPMLSSYAAPGPQHALPGKFVNSNLMLPFDQVYWKRDSTPTRPAPKPVNGSGDPPCNGIAWYGACFFYASAAENILADGGGMTLQIEKPVVDDSGGGGHSIGEIAVDGFGGPGAGLNDVEIGFSVDPDQWGDNDPHLFVYHWNNGNETCYNSCRWRPASNTYYAGMDLSSLVGQQIYTGWVYYQGAWWAWFNDQWLGNIPDSAWDIPFTQALNIHWYGEVASNNGIPPQTQMGNGLLPTFTTAATMSTLCDVDSKTWVCTIRDQQATGATQVNYYNIVNHSSFGAVRYGGSIAIEGILNP
jgi:hypothetical protein